MCKIICPQCFSSDLHKFGKDPKTLAQKYRCKHCKRQFTTNSNSSQRERKPYPKCPICNKGTYLHHDYEYYSSFTCNDKSCGNSIKILKKQAIDKISSQIDEKSIIKRSRTPLNLIIHALYLYFVNNSSTRNIANFFNDRFNYKVSHVSIHKWTRRFSPIFTQLMEEYRPENLHDSDEWHVDETVVKIQGKRHYIWTLIDSETRYIMAWHLTKSREASEAFKLFNYAKDKYGSPKSIVSDRLPSYTFPVKSVFPNTKHIKVQKFSDTITNNLIESFFSKFKARYKASRGLKAFDSTNKILTGFFFCYNYIRPHQSLNLETPARVAGIEYSEHKRKNLLLA